MFTHAQEKNATWWEIQSIDTMKYSRDLAREKSRDKKFIEEMGIQINNIKNTGVTHVAIATPYDEEFIPFLKEWVNVARANGLKVWFRGNWSGWEGWFDYPKITRQEHIKKSVEFISKHHYLFEAGDIFSPCPECENGGPGDPRLNGDLQGHREFLIKEYSETKKVFTNLGLAVSTNFSPMNADVAKLVMDQATTRAMGGIVVIDHYVESPQEIYEDITTIAKESGGKIVLGEFGAPIPDIHGKMSDLQQKKWLEDTLKLLTQNSYLIGTNYWVNIGGTTEIWDEKNTPKPAVDSLTKYYSPKIAQGRVLNELKKPLGKSILSTDNYSFNTNEQGEFTLKFFENDTTFKATADGYKSKDFVINTITTNTDIILVKEHEGIIFKIQKFLFRLFNKS